MNRLTRGLASILLLLLSSCSSNRVITPQLTQLQLREIQTSIYETNDIKMVMKTMINVLQDDGYIVKNADANLGLLNAVKEIDIEDSRRAFWAQMLVGPQADWEKQSIIEASVNISEFGERTKARVNFQSKIISSKGAVFKVHQITEPAAYQDFFSKVSKGLFIQYEGL